MTRREPGEGPKTLEEFATMVHPDDRERVTIAAMDLLEGRGSPEIEYRLLCPDGEVRWFLGRGTAVTDESGRVVKIVGGMLDVTERRAMEEKLAQTQKLEAVGQLTAGIAHNFNNMLAGVLPAVELAQKTAPPNIAPLLKQAAEVTMRAAELVKQLLLFAGRGRRSAPRPVDPVRVAEQTVAMCRTTFDRRIELALRTHGAPAGVEVDPSQLQQVILNLLINARDAVGEVDSPRIDVHVDMDGGRVRIRVEDNGCGMDEKTRRRVFEPFFSTKSPGRGTGLGLASSFGIVRDAGGSIECTSAPRSGTSFTVLLPASAKVDPAPQSSRLKNTRGTERILLVDDEQAVRATLKLILEGAGYKVSQAENGKDALEMLRAHHFDVIVLDHSMPRLSGIAALRAILELEPDAKVIGFTGFPEPMPGARATLMKPVDAATLLSTLRSVLDA
jgi:signal transduction histidine kinase/CheY-like chemotaxis protein